MKITPNGGDIGLTLFAPCEHSRWVLLRDRLQRREHPPMHAVYHSPLATAYTDTEFDLDAPSFWTGENAPPIFWYKQDGSFGLAMHTHPALPKGAGVLGCPACVMEATDGPEG